MKLDKKAYERLIQEDIAAVEANFPKHSLEKTHIIDVLRESVNQFYPKMELIKTDVKFRVNGKLIKFSIIHDMPEKFGMSFNNALDSWLARTDVYSAESLVAYIKSKETGNTAMTEKEYKH